MFGQLSHRFTPGSLAAIRCPVRSENATGTRGLRRVRRSGRSRADARNLTGAEGVHAPNLTGAEGHRSARGTRPGRVPFAPISGCPPVIGGPRPARRHSGTGRATGTQTSPGYESRCPLGAQRDRRLRKSRRAGLRRCPARARSSGRPDRGCGTPVLSGPARPANLTARQRDRQPPYPEGSPSFFCAPDPLPCATASRPPSRSAAAASLGSGTHNADALRPRGRAR
jgi:hypothetical protein